MKKLIFPIVISAFLIAGCSSNQTKQQKHNNDVHKHGDGSVHQNHEEDTATKQEEFAAHVDTTSQKVEPVKEHTHDGQDGHKHPHNH